MAIPAHIAEFWQLCARSVAMDEARYYDTYAFGDNADLADTLAALVLAGVKRATAGAVWSYEAEGLRLPAPGDLSVVTDSAGKPLCVVETTAVDIVPFNQVGADFAAAEGEGDGSLAFWRRVHRQYFTRECTAAGRRFTEDMPVACERFKLVFRAPFLDE